MTPCKVAGHDFRARLLGLGLSPHLADSSLPRSLFQQQQFSSVLSPRHAHSRLRAFAQVALAGWNVHVFDIDTAGSFSHPTGSTDPSSILTSF